MQRRHLLALPALLLAGCAGMTGAEPLRVQLVGLDPLPGEGLELRFASRLRLQNPNGRAIDFTGVSVEVSLQGTGLAYGVSDSSGTLPAYGEVVLVVPVSISAMGIARTVLNFFAVNDHSRVEYALRGKLGTGFGGMHFEAAGVLQVPAGGDPP